MTATKEKSLPTGWKWAKLLDVCDFQGGTQPPKDTFKRYPENGYIRLLQIQDFKTEQYAVYIKDEEGLRKCTASDILLGRYGASVGRVLRGKAGAYNVALVKTVPDYRYIDSDYLYYTLRNDDFQVLLQSVSNRAAQAGFNKSDFKSYQIPLPPLPEQKRIAAILTEQLAAVDRARAAAEAQLQAAKQLPAAFLSAVFDSPEAQQWPKTRLGKHVTKIGSGITPSGGQSSYLATGIPLIRSQNVHMNRFVPSGLAFISQEQDKVMTGSRVQPHDVLLNITGASIGRACVVPDRLCPANVNQHVSIIRLDGSIKPHFLSLFLSVPAFQEFIMDAQSGATRQALTKALIENFIVPFPSLAQQQQVITTALAQMDKAAMTCNAISEQLDAITQLPATLLRQAFSGDL